MTETTVTPEKGAADGSALAAVIEMKNEQIPHEVVASEKIEGSRIRYEVKVPAATFLKKAEESLGDFQKQAQLPGFRRGKAPIHLVRNRFLNSAQEEAIRKMVPRLADLVAEEQKVTRIAQPIYTGWEQLNEQKDIKVGIVLEVRPEIALTQETFKDIVVEVKEHKVTDEVLAAELDNLRARNAVFEAKDDAVYERFDGARLTLQGFTPAGQPIPQLTASNEYSQELHKELPGPVYEALLGKKVGETFEVADVLISQPSDQDEPVKANFKVALHEVKKRVLPALDDEFAKDVSAEFKSVDDLRSAVRKDLEKNAENNTRTETLNAIYKAIGERVTFDLPPSVVQKLAENSIQRAERQLNQYGLTFRRMGQDFINNYLRQAEAEARVEAKNQFIADEVGRFLNVEVSDVTVDSEIARIAEAQGRKPLAIRAQLEAQKRLDGFKAELRIKLVNDKLISLATVKTVPATA